MQNILQSVQCVLYTYNNAGRISKYQVALLKKSKCILKYLCENIYNLTSLNNLVSNKIRFL